jgi:hypothetical protein
MIRVPFSEMVRPEFDHLEKLVDAAMAGELEGEGLAEELAGIQARVLLAMIASN